MILTIISLTFSNRSVMKEHGKISLFITFIPPHQELIHTLLYALPMTLDTVTDVTSSDQDKDSIILAVYLMAPSGVVRLG